MGVPGDRDHAARVSYLLDVVLRRIVAVVFVVLRLLVIYALVTFTLRRFPYTRPWGESLRGALFAFVGDLARGIVNAIPELLMIVAIVVITRVAIKREAGLSI